MNLLRDISEHMHFFFKDYFPDSFVFIFQVVSNFLLLILVIYLTGVVLNGLVDFLLKFLQKKSKKFFVQAIIDSKVHRSFAHLVPLMMSKFFISQIFWMHPVGSSILNFVFMVFEVIVMVMMIDRFLKAIEKYFILINDRYKVTAFRAIYETAKIISYFIMGIVVVSRISGVTMAGILGYLGAITAVLLLVFRDTILGFVTGVHVSTSKNLKVGDWISIKKYEIEGVVGEINLLTTKIQNFDKTISTIPTYDLLSTEIRNHQVMYDGRSRRIKRSVYFNIKSFKFIDDDMFEELRKINLISDYLNEKYTKIKKDREKLHNSGKIINTETITNIGLFRKYTLEYLKVNQNIEQKDILLVRQMEITPQGMPLEIYCFSKKADLANYEEIQADIFDHILTAAKEFQLEVIQISLK